MIAKTCIPEAQLCAVGLDVLCGCRDDGVGEELEIGIFQAFWDACLKVLDTNDECLIVLDALFHLRNRKAEMPDSFRFALGRKTIVFESNFAHFIGKISSEGLLGPPS